MKKLSYVDKGFLMTETREMPMHVGGVSLYTLPDGADEHEFMHSLARNVRDADALLPPFGDRLLLGRLGLAGNAYWEADPAMDMDYHVRHSALPKPGRYRELFNLVHFNLHQLLNVVFDLSVMRQAVISLADAEITNSKRITDLQCRDSR